MIFFLYLCITSAYIVTEEVKAFKPLDTPEAFALEQPLPFPEWLSELTGLSNWPGVDPPYIPLDFVDFSVIPGELESWVHTQGSCQSIENTADVCSFDCWACATEEDVVTCPVLSQTFDDGPSPFTLDLIDKLETPVTFFTIGINVVRFPHVYRKTANKGHIMASHTWSHKFLPSLTNEEIIAQIEWSVWAMNATQHHLPKWFRPPYGGIDNRIRSILHHFGMQAVLWDFDSLDWALAAGQGKETEEELHERLLDFSEKRNNRGLILEHDSFEKTVNIGKGLYELVGSDQLTVPQCVEGIDYIKTWDSDCESCLV